MILLKLPDVILFENEREHKMIPMCEGSFVCADELVIHKLNNIWLLLVVTLALKQRLPMFRR
jgi:hypothetical protein